MIISRGEERAGRRAGHNRTVISSRGEERAGHMLAIIGLIISRGEERADRRAGHNRTVIISREEERAGRCAGRLLVCPRWWFHVLLLFLLVPEECHQL